MNKEERKQIALTIIDQLGGAGKLKSFVNARNYLILDSGVAFDFSGSRSINYLAVRLNDLDTYDLRFGQKRKDGFKTRKEYSGVYCDQLIDIFELTTNLFLHF